MFRKPKRKAVTRTRDQDEQQDDGKRLGEDGDVRETSLRGGDGAGEASAVRLRGRDDNDDDEEETSELFRRGSKRRKPTGLSSTTMSNVGGSADRDDAPSVMHSYGTGSLVPPTHAELATRAAEHHSAGATKSNGSAASSSSLPSSAAATAADDDELAGKGPDGIFRNRARNKFAAGPIRAQTNVRVTARFDYQPDICVDYRATGFCGFGDSCIYLHDRGDTMSGWQLEQAWEKRQEADRKKRAQEEQVQAFVDSHGDGRKNGTNLGGGDGASTTSSWMVDGLPFACYLCRKAFVDPVAASCNHYFCESCILNHVRTESDLCPVCQQETNGVFNHPTKLVAKMKRVLRSTNGGGERSQHGHDAPSSWQAYYDAMANPGVTDAK